MKKVFVIIGCGVLLVGGLYLVRMNLAVVKFEILYNTKELMLGNTRYTLEVADTATLRERGLSYRTSLAPQTGMLFVFDTPRVLKFWMKGMNFPLDIIWFDQNKKVIHIEYSVSPLTYPQSFGPTTPAQYVIEFNAGDIHNTGLRVGDKVDF